MWRWAGRFALPFQHRPAADASDIQQGHVSTSAWLHRPRLAGETARQADVRRHPVVHCLLVGTNTHPVLCEKRTRESGCEYSRQASIQFMVSRENIIRCPRAAKRFHEEYKVEGEIGKGAFGKVWRVRHLASDQIRAAKEIKERDLGEEQWNIFEIEVEFLTKLDHPNVVRLIEFFNEGNEGNGSMFLILEICRGPDLFDWMSVVFANAGFFTEKEAGRLLRNMLKAVLCCHCNNICHRDIKPENFMFPTPDIEQPLKMIDLGLSEKFGDGNALEGAIGTVGYMAPEVLKGRYSRECDMWSLGVIFYLLLTGRTLLPTEMPQKDVDKLLVDGKYVTKQLATHTTRASTEARDLLRRMLQWNPKDRITAQEALQHPFIRSSYEGGEGETPSSPAVATARSANSRDEYSRIAAMLEHYARQPMLKRAALLLLAHVSSVEESSLRVAQRAFRRFDADGNGELTTAEIEEAFKLKGVELPDGWGEIAKRVDIDMSGRVRYVEWTAATLPAKVYCGDQYLRAAFQFLDVRQKAEVSWEDVGVVFPSLKKRSIAEQKKVLINAVGKTSFTFEDFKRMMERDSL